MIVPWMFFFLIQTCSYKSNSILIHPFQSPIDISCHEAVCPVRAIIHPDSAKRLFSCYAELHSDAVFAYAGFVRLNQRSLSTVITFLDVTEELFAVRCLIPKVEELLGVLCIGLQAVICNFVFVDNKAFGASIMLFCYCITLISFFNPLFTAGHVPSCSCERRTPTSCP